MHEAVKDDPETLEISVDTKAKVSLGEYALGGKHLQPHSVYMHVQDATDATLTIVLLPLALLRCHVRR